MELVAFASPRHGGGAYAFADGLLAPHGVLGFMPDYLMDDPEQTRAAARDCLEDFLSQFQIVPGDVLPDVRRLLRVHAVRERDIHEQVIAIARFKRELAGPFHFDDLKSRVEGVPVVEDGEEEVS